MNSNEFDRYDKKIAEIFSVPPTTVQTWIKKYKTTGSLDRTVGSGRKKCTSKRLDRHIIIETKRNPFITLGYVLQKYVSISTKFHEINKMKI